jgi:hypothetical protein
MDPQCIYSLTLRASHGLYFECGDRAYEYIFDTVLKGEVAKNLNKLECINLVHFHKKCSRQ